MLEAEFFKDEPATEPPPRAEDKNQEQEQKQEQKRTDQKIAGEKAKPKAQPDQDQEQREEQEPQVQSETKRSDGEPKPSPRQESLDDSARRAQEKPKERQPRTAPTPGRGGQQHKRLYSFLQHLGHSKGYRVIIEKEILGGTGSVDVALEKNLSIACEISVTTDVEHELGNVQKCLAAGFDPVMLLSGNKATLNKVRALAKASIGDHDLTRVQFLTSEEFYAFLEGLDASAASKEQTVRGYKVKTNYQTVSEAEKRARKKVIAEAILEALREKKEQDKNEEKDQDKENDQDEDRS